MTDPFRTDVRRLIGRLINREMYATDAQYHAEIARFRQWLVLTEMALRDEGVPDSTAARVLRRITYGTPSGADAYERVALISPQEWRQP